MKKYAFDNLNLVTYTERPLPNIFEIKFTE